MDDFKAELAESFWEIERSNKVLRTTKDRDGVLAFEVAPGRFWFSQDRSTAERQWARSTDPKGGFSYDELDENFGPLTDVTGEPLDATECRCTGDDHWHDRDLDSEGFCSHCNSTQCRATPTVAGEPLDADMQLADDPEYAKFCEEQDTPRKPEPGDRVRVSYEAEYHEHANDGHFVRPNDLDFPILTPSDVEITVIEPARPVVPEDPKRDLEEVWHDDEGDEMSEVHEYDRRTGRYVGIGGSNTWEHLWTWTQEYGHKLYPLVVERGPVIGGE